MDSKSFIIINLDQIEEGLQLTIDSKVDNTLFVLSDALENGEAEQQLVEGFSYDYEFNNNRYTLAKDQIVQPHTRNKHIGTISPNIYVGTLRLPILKDEIEIGNLSVEVRSLKADYREDYRDMLEFITERCSDLLMQSDSPSFHNFETDFEKDYEVLYQKFAFIKSIIDTDEFGESLHRIVSTPVTQWKDINSTRDIRNVRRFNNSNVRELIKASNRICLPENHYLKEYGLHTLPSKIESIRKTDSVDTPENRFVKFALESFMRFCSVINKKSKKDSRLWQESGKLEEKLESFLHHSIFREISHPETLRLNSPVLQRKEGYREVLRIWLMFDLAAKLVWKGGEDVYQGGKKDIATLYEYWLFFKLLDLLKSIFELEPKALSELIKETEDGLCLQIKQGLHTALNGIYKTDKRIINVRFNYNRSFQGFKDYPLSGSWTTTMRPDYTLSLWPYGISEKEAENQELIVHIHFDGKYKIANLKDLLKDINSDDLKTEKEENRKGIYKNADLLKMHAYKDAIRRTGGAYVLYPGDTSIKKSGFHEIIPGLGAFTVRPSKTDDGISELKDFILEVINHFVNRTSQREKMAFRTFDIYKNKPGKGDAINELVPESYGKNRDLIPDDTFIMVGFYKSQEHFDWILENKLYNFRTGSDAGSIILDQEVVSSKYLLLHTSGDNHSGNLLKIVSKGPRFFSKTDLLKKNYPSDSEVNKSYLVIEIEAVTDPEFSNMKWDFRKLRNYSSGRMSAVPFTVSLTELMKCKV